MAILAVFAAVFAAWLTYIVDIIEVKILLPGAGFP
jgi:hypothetical protein